jgi:DNA-binding beta-propeller fold protein YncE
LTETPLAETPLASKTQALQPAGDTPAVLAPVATVTQPSPTGISTAGTTPPPTELQVTQALTPSGPVVLPESLCCFGQPLDAGVYRTPDWFDIPFMITIGDGWRSIASRGENLLSIVRGPHTIGSHGESRSTEWVVFIPIPGNLSPEAVWEEVRATPGLVAGEDSAVTIAGLPAKQFEGTPDPDQISGSNLRFPIFEKILFPDQPEIQYYTESLEVDLRFILLQVGDQHLIVDMEAPKEVYEAFAAEAEQALETLQFEGGALAAAGEFGASPVELVLEIKGDPNPLDRPGGVGVDVQGNVYLVDGGNNRLQVFDGQGEFLRTWGSAGAGEGQFNFIDTDGTAYGAVDAAGQGNVYVADTFNYRVQKFDSQGNFLAQWGSQGTGDGQFQRPIDVTVDSQGNVYVIDDFRNVIQVFDGKGNFQRTIGAPGAGDGQFQFTGGLAVDARDYIYVADFGNRRVQVFDNQGNFTAKWPLQGSGEPSDIALDDQGNIYVVNYTNHNVQEFDPGGNFIRSWRSFGPGEDRLEEPTSVAIDPEGFLYVSDYANDRILKFKPLSP